jgi:hypothetical protein
MSTVNKKFKVMIMNEKGEVVGDAVVECSTIEGARILLQRSAQHLVPGDKFDMSSIRTCV